MHVVKTHKHKNKHNRTNSKRKVWGKVVYNERWSLIRANIHQRPDCSGIIKLTIVAGDVSFPHLKGLWGKVDDSFPPMHFFFFFEVEISMCILSPFIRPGSSVHSGSASWDNYGRVFPDKLHVGSFPDRLPHYSWRAEPAHTDFIGSRMYVCLVVTCHLHFWQNNEGLSCATAVKLGWNWHRIKTSTKS